MLHGRSRELAADDPAFLGPRDEPGILEHAQVFQETGQGHFVRGGELADGKVVAGERLEHSAAGAIGKRGKNHVELIVAILNHKV